MKRKLSDCKFVCYRCGKNFGLNDSAIQLNILIKRNHEDNAHWFICTDCLKSLIEWRDEGGCDEKAED